MTSSFVPSGSVISTILRHDAKVTSYKVALLRAINDVVLSFPDMHGIDRDVAVPLRLLAEFWVAYYWPFVAPDVPILQGPRAKRGDTWTNDMAFRPALTALRAQWETLVGGMSRPADGFFLINELRLPRKRAAYPPSLVDAAQTALRAIIQTLEMPIRHAGPGEWTVFDKPRRRAALGPAVTSVPGTQDGDTCLVVTADLWHTFAQLSLWVEALCIHEWCLFIETVAQDRDEHGQRGLIYTVLTDRPDNRRPLTWERNHIDLLLMEGHSFICPWTERRLDVPGRYDVDHVLPISVYAYNELWNLVPADPYFNMHVKRDRLPSTERLERARPHLCDTYATYGLARPLAQALAGDVSVRFSRIPHNQAHVPEMVAGAVIDLVERVANARNLARF